MGAAGIGALVIVGSIALALTLADSVTPGNWLTTTRGRWLAALLGSAFFLTAGVYRLARWRLIRDPHAALAGTALVVMGGLAIPAQYVTELLVPGDPGDVTALAMRGAASLVAMVLLLRALGSRRLHRLETPEQLLPLLLVSIASIITPVMILEAADLAAIPSRGTIALLVPPVLLAVAWTVLAIGLHRAAGRSPWAGRAAPLVAAMGVAEVCRAAGHAREAWILLAAVVTAGVGWLAARSARRDLDRTSESERARQRHLYDQLEVITGEVEEFVDWRSAVRHDARNTCAGLRAAMSLLCGQDATIRPDVAGRLRDAAVTELRNLESLLDVEGQAPATYDVLSTLRQAAAPLRSLDAHVRVTGERAFARGEPGDLTLVIRELLLRSLTAVPPTDVTMLLEQRDGRLWVRYVEDLPVITTLSDLGEDAGLRAARHLMRRQGGDLRIFAGDGPGVDLPEPASLILTLTSAPSAPPTATRSLTTRPELPHLVGRRG